MTHRFSPASLWAILGAILCASAVMAGAYGWHRLAADETAQEIFMLAVQYHMWHGLALFAVAWAAEFDAHLLSFASAAGAAFLAGVILFSANIYAFAITGDYILIGAAPAGGFALIAGWEDLP